MNCKHFTMQALFILSLLMSVFISPATSTAQTENAVKDYLNVPGPVVMDSKSYNLAWSSHPSVNFYKQEYLTRGDIAAKFKTMVLLDVSLGKQKLKDIVDAKVSELKAMKAANPIVNYEIFEKNGEYLLDFLLSANGPDGKSIEIIERNVYRYKTITLQQGQKGILLFGVSTRSYGKEVDKFLVDLKSNKQSLIDEVAKFIMPVIKILK